MKKLLFLTFLFVGCSAEKDCKCVVDTLNNNHEVTQTNDTNKDNCEKYSPNTIVANPFGGLWRFRTDCQ